MPKLMVAGYFTIGSTILYVMWYISLWWWRKPQKQTWREFWGTETRIKDLKKRGESEDIRFVRFSRTAVAFLVCIVLSSFSLFLPRLAVPAGYKSRDGWRHLRRMLTGMTIASSKPAQQ